MSSVSCVVCVMCCRLCHVFFRVLCHIFPRLCIACRVVSCRSCILLTLCHVSFVSCVISASCRFYLVCFVSWVECRFSKVKLVYCIEHSRLEMFVCILLSHSWSGLGICRVSHVCMFVYRTSFKLCASILPRVCVDALSVVYYLIMVCARLFCWYIVSLLFCLSCRLELVIGVNNMRKFSLWNVVLLLTV